MKKASIVTIGDELLIGQVIDTNSAWIAQKLNPLGIEVVERIAVVAIFFEDCLPSIKVPADFI